jgi:hypothetical protein
LLLVKKRYQENGIVAAVISMSLTLEIIVFGKIWNKCSEKLTEKEYHETELAHHVGIGNKRWWARVINTGASFGYIAFLEKDWDGLAVALRSTFSIYLVTTVVTMFFPVWEAHTIFKRKQKEAERLGLTDEGSFANYVPNHVELEVKKERYTVKDVGEDFAEVVIPILIVASFGSSWPPILIMMIAFIIAQIHADSWKLMNLTGRPFPYAPDEGLYWKNIHILDASFHVACVTNICIIAFTVLEHDQQNLWRNIVAMVIGYALFNVVLNAYLHFFVQPKLDLAMAQGRYQGKVALEDANDDAGRTDIGSFEINLNGSGEGYFDLDDIDTLEEGDVSYIASRAGDPMSFMPESIDWIMTKLTGTKHSYFEKDDDDTGKKKDKKGPLDGLEKPDEDRV